MSLYKALSVRHQQQMVAPLFHSLLALLLSLVLCNALSSDTPSYAGYSVVRAELKDERDVKVVDGWALDVWSRDSVLAVGLNDIVVNDTHKSGLAQLGVSFTSLIADVQQHLDEAELDLKTSRAEMLAADFFTAYHTYTEYVAYFANLTKSYPSISSMVNVGTTIQGRNIPGIVITGTSGNNKKKIFVSGGQHAREWVAPATSAYLITQLITLYGRNAAVTSIMNSVVFHFVPMVNPDGYVYTWSTTSARLWRKNRRLNSGGSYGVDLNRNWDDHWGGQGSSGTQTSDTYRGTSAFSEPETKAVANYVLANGPFRGAIDYHCYSQLILRPYGWTSTYPPNEALSKRVGDGIRSAILGVSGVAYTSEASWELYYTTGSAQDWYYSAAGVPLSYTIELRDTGRYGFQLPANQIKPTGQENWAGFVSFSQAVIAN